MAHQGRMRFSRYAPLTMCAISAHSAAQCAEIQHGMVPPSSALTARPVIARATSRLAKSPYDGRHCTPAQKPCLSINALPFVPSAARGYGANCLDRMVPRREHSLASGTIGPAYLARCQDVSTHSLLVCERSLLDGM